jgi:polysaccharide export outer membrane protein
MMKLIVIFWFILFLIGGQLGTLLGSQDNYRLGAEDEIQIRVWSHDDLTRTTRVGLNGTISFPFVDEIKAQGLSVQELQKELERRLGPKYVVDPHVTITVTEFKSQKFFVVGNVQKPGTYPLTKPIRVVEAISQAGGLSAAPRNGPYRHDANFTL